MYLTYGHIFLIPINKRYKLHILIYSSRNIDAKDLKPIEAQTQQWKRSLHTVNAITCSDRRQG